jgi:glycosyltransferase involved in cell wall biosynthesis/radical SAM superfamily enzyme YgiQ (UPF0313 family)
MKTLRVLLISTLSGEGLGFVKHGLGIISSCLKKEGHHTYILNNPENVEKAITNFNPDIIGISGLSNSFQEMLTSAQISRKINPKIPIFAGGVAPTLSPEDFDNETNRILFDYVFCGEAEITFTKIINDYAASGILPNERRIKGEVVYNLDDLPFVDRSGYENGEMKHPLFNKYSGRMFSMLNSRWCRKKCRFCAPASATIFGGVKKLRSVDNFIAEIKTLPKDSLLMVQDDNMIENLEWAEEFVEKYKFISYPFICQAYPAEIIRAEQLLKKLKDIGLVGVFVGFESGSNRMLQYMRKGTNREIIIKAADILHRLNIDIQANLMFGCPTETYDEMMETVEIFNKYIYPARPSPAVYTPYPGSYWYEELKNNGLITITNSKQYERYENTSDKIKGVNYDEVRQAISLLRQKTEHNISPHPKASALPLMPSKSTPLVSVCIPVYNGEKYISEALESVIAQTYSNIEIIISDNDSDDKTLEIIQSFKKRFKFEFLILLHRQYGMIQNWNFCISHAKGKYIKYLFCDDLLEPTCIEEMVNLAEQDEEIGLVFSPRKLIIEENKDIHRNDYKNIEDIYKYWSDLQPIQSGQKLLHDPNLFNNSINKIGEPSTVLIKKEVFERVGLFDSEIYHLIDLDMWFRIMNQFKVGFVNNVLSYFRIHSKQATYENTKKDLLLLDLAMFFQKIYTNVYYPHKIREEAFQRFNALCIHNPDLKNMVTQTKSGKPPIVSICIPTFNGEKFLAETLSSALSQTYSNIEIIISDDGSTDRTLEIAKSFQDKTSKEFVIISHRNYGLIQNWNFCITKAHGQYIKFLFQDDLLEPDCIEKMVEIAEQDEEIGMVFSPRGIILDEKDRNDRFCMCVYNGASNLHIHWSNLKPIQEGKELLSDPKLMGEPPNKIGEPSTVMIKKEVFEKIGGFDGELCQLVDMEMWLRIMSQYKIAFVNKILSHFRVHLEQQTRKNADKGNTIVADWQRYYDKIYKDQRYPEKVRKEALNGFETIAQRYGYQIQTQHCSFEQKKPEVTLVSICIPTYNGEKFLSDALSSVLSQTYPNIEIIISDDGSTDRTLEIAKSFQNQTSKDFIVISHRNYGLVPNWNFCIQHAKGKYIKFLHQDDRLEPDCIRELINIAEQDDEIGLVFSARGLLMSAGAENDPSCMSDYQHVRDLHKSWAELQTLQSGHKLLEDPNLFNWPINKFGEPTTVLIRKEVFDKIGGFDPELRQLVDVEMWLRIMSQYKIGFSDKVLSHWRIHPEQQTRKNAREHQTMTADWQKFYDKIAKDSRYPEKVRQEALRRLTDIKQQSDMNLRNERKHLSESWLKLPPEFLEKAYSGDMGNVHRRLIESNLRNEPLTQEENAFLQMVITELTKRSATDPASAINYLLAAILYLPSDRLKIENARASLPGWLIGDYERFFGVQK